jgi:hypothetical protein
MGKSDGISMQFDLPNLIKTVDGLDELIVSFHEKEMDDVIREMHVDRVSGLDGFNGLFFKKCWHITKKDFY